MNHNIFKTCFALCRCGSKTEEPNGGREKNPWEGVAYIYHLYQPTDCTVNREYPMAAHGCGLHHCLYPPPPV